MSDIFISYKREEQPEARKLAIALEREGWDVWWDPKLRAGEHFDDVIEKALMQSKCVVVMWSKLSVNSRYVKDEATFALNRLKLVPVAIEHVELPFRFEGLHTPSLIDWDGSDDSPEFLKLVEDVTAIIGEPARQRGTNLHEVRRSYVKIDQQEEPFADETDELIAHRLALRSDAELCALRRLLVEGKLVEATVADRLKENGFGMVNLNDLKTSTEILDRDFVGNWFVKPEYKGPLTVFFQAVSTPVAGLVFDPSSVKHVQRGNVTRKGVGGDQECDEYKYAIGVVNLTSKPIVCQLILEHSDPHDTSAQRLEIPLRVRGQVREGDGKFTLAPGNRQPTVYVEVLQELVLKSNPLNEHAIIRLTYANSADGQANCFVDHRDHVLTFRLQGEMPKPVTIRLSVRSKNRRYEVRQIP